MSVINLIKKRRSMREFSHDEVEFHKITDMIEAAMHAPNAGNLQNWKFIVVKDQMKRELIADACVEQLWIADAPVIIIVCAEEERAEKYYEERGKDLYNIQNCAAAVQNMLLVATEQGLATCWVGAFDEKKIKDALEVPDNVKITTVLPVGYTRTKPGTKHIIDIKEVFYFESWGTTIKNIHRIMSSENATFKDIMIRSKELIQRAGQKLKEKVSRTKSP